MSSTPEVSCVIPTMNRPELLERTLTRLFESTKGIDVQAVVVIDESWESRAICERMVSEGKNIIFSFSPTQRGAIPCWNIGLALAWANIFFHQGDDLEFEDGWLDKALEAHRTRLDGYGLCGVNDSMHDGNICSTHVLFDRQFCIDHLGGVMANPTLKYYGADVWLNERAKKAGRFYWCKEAVVMHIHPANGKRPRDDTDMSHEEFWTEDINAMEVQRSMGLPITWQPVLK